MNASPCGGPALMLILLAREYFVLLPQHKIKKHRRHSITICAIYV
jgi:hypothetical protein